MVELPRQEHVIGGYWSEGYRGQISAIGEAASKVWTKHIGKSGKIWLVPTYETENTMVIVEGEPGSQGFGGREMHFQLDDGTQQMLKGPWSSNQDSLFSDTGVDRRALFRTWGCIGRDMSHVAYTTRYGASVATINDLVYVDPPDGIVGVYSRIDDLAKQIAFERREILFKHSEIYGGSSRGCVMPYEGDPVYIEAMKNTRWIDQEVIRTKYKSQTAEYWAAKKAEFGDFKYDVPAYICDSDWLEGIDFEPPKPEPVVYADEYDEDGERYY